MRRMEKILSTSLDDAQRTHVEQIFYRHFSHYVPLLVFGKHDNNENVASRNGMRREVTTSFISYVEPMEIFIMTSTLLNRPVENSIDLNTVIFPKAFPRIEQSKTFKHAIDIYLKDSNATGNVYFARYFEWQGICREKWFFECIAADMLQSIGVFITKEAQQSFIHETYAFQKVDCEVNTFAIRQCSFSLLFRFFVAGSLVSAGHQQIVFSNLNKKIARLPAHVIDKIRQYEVAEETAELLH
jgi:acyl-CoA thioesterase FadM